MHLFSSFSANTLLVQYVHNVLHFSLSLSVPVLVFCFFLHRFATVRFGVLLWRPGFKSWFQLGDWFFGNGSIVASGTEKIFPALCMRVHALYMYIICSKPISSTLPVFATSNISQDHGTAHLSGCEDSPFWRFLSLARCMKMCSFSQLLLRASPTRQAEWECALSCTH